MAWSRGNVIWAQLDPVKKGEQGKTRPCVVVSYDAMNHSKHPCLIVCPITGQENVHKKYPTHVLIPKGIVGMVKNSLVMAEQIRTISRERISSKEAKTLPKQIILKLDKALQKVLSL